MKKIFLFALVAIAMCACSDSTMLKEPLENLVLSRSNDQSPTMSYSVTPDMVCKYLNIACNGKTIDSITPVIEDGDTLAYVAQYTENDGWELISGDKRLEPVLALSDNGVLDISNKTEPSVCALGGLFKYINDLKHNQQAQQIHHVWKAFEPKQMNLVMPAYDGVQGMWVAVDTVNENSQQRVDRLIKTKWGQKSPWFDYTPWIEYKDENSPNNDRYLTHSPVGCAAVAAGQIIYHFRKNNNRNILLPTKVSFTDTIDGSTPSFNDFSVTGWNNMAEKSSETGTEKTAKFLSFLGKQLNMEYKSESSSTISEDSLSTVFNQVFDNYKINSFSLFNYNYDKLVESLMNGSPVLICAKKDQLNGHVFIIDKYIKNIERTYVTYQWDPNYKVTEDDLRYAEPWRFQEPVSGRDEKDVDLYVNSGSKISMNWGEGGICDNTYYASSIYLRVGESDDTYTELPYSPYWTYTDGNDSDYYNNVTYMLYNFHELSN